MNQQYYTVYINGQTYHEGSTVGGALSTISEWPCDGEVSVEADDEQVQDTGVARQVVKGQPCVTDPRTKWPVAHQCGHGEQGHRDQSDGEVGHCKATQDKPHYY